MSGKTQLVFLAAILMTAIGCSTKPRIVQEAMYGTPFPGYLNGSFWADSVCENAQLVPAGVTRARYLEFDQEYFITTKWSDPVRQLIIPMHWDQRCGGTIKQPGYTRFPDDFLLADATSILTPNNVAAILQPDGRTIVNVNPLTRCAKADTVYGWFAGIDSINGTGQIGGHGGSGLSIWGSIGLGELIDTDVIHHVVKVNIDAKRFCAVVNGIGYRWPATRHDSYALTGYRGENPELRMGSLLTLPKSLTPDSLGLRTVPGKCLFRTLQRYGAYVADDAGSDAFALCVQHKVPAQFQDRYGYSMKSQRGPWFEDMMAIITHLQVVASNDSRSVGGCANN